MCVADYVPAISQRTASPSIADSSQMRYPPFSAALEHPSKVRAEVSNVNQVFLDVEGVVDEADEVQVNVSEATEVAGIVDEAVKVKVNVSEATTSNSADNYNAVKKSHISFKRQAQNKLGSIRKKIDRLV